MTQTPTRVVNVKHEECDVYIGRAMPGWPASEFANEFKLGRDGDKPTVLAKYRERLEQRLQGSAELRASLERLRGRRIGCWCKPKPGVPHRPEHACHGDILVELLGETPAAATAPVQTDLFG